MIKLISDEFDDLPALTEEEIKAEVDALNQQLENSTFQYTIAIASWVKPLIEWFWLNKSRILKNVEDNIPLAGDHYGFQVYYPEYGGMPKFISSQLNDTHLNLINSKVIFMLNDYPDEKDFKKKLFELLTNSTIVLS